MSFLSLSRLFVALSLAAGCCGAKTAQAASQIKWPLGSHTPSGATPSFLLPVWESPNFENFNPLASKTKVHFVAGKTTPTPIKTAAKPTSAPTNNPKPTATPRRASRVRPASVDSASASPSFGDAGDSVTITLSGNFTFTSIQDVSYEGQSTAFSFDNDSGQIDTSVPLGAPSGPGNFSVSYSDGYYDDNSEFVTYESSISASFTVNATPRISSLSRSSGPNGCYVTINGQDLDLVETVEVGGTGVPTQDIERISANQIRIVVPNGATSGPITVSDINSSGDSSPFSVTAVPASLTVANTSDAGSGSLREALRIAQNATAALTVRFNISSAATVASIKPLSDLPPITADNITIDGSTQPNTNASGLDVEINGALLPITAPQEGVFEIQGGRTTIKNLAINGFGQTARLRNQAPFAKAAINASDGNSGGHTISGCYLGTNANGTVAVPNTVGLNIESTNGGAQNTIENCVISGNKWAGAYCDGQSVIFTGNRVGVNASGTQPLPNDDESDEPATISAYGSGLVLASSNAANRIENNVLSGNAGPGLVLLDDTNGTLIINNKIGTNANGTGSLGNVYAGIQLRGDVSGVSIQNNVISGNTRFGIEGNAYTNSDSIFVYGNKIGTNAGGNGPIPNGENGLDLILDTGGPLGALGFFDVKVGGTGANQGNIIAFNRSTGVNLTLDAGQLLLPTVRGNAIFGNRDLGINNTLSSENAIVQNANDNPDSDGLQNFPEITKVTFEAAQNRYRLEGTLRSSANENFDLDFFANARRDESGFGEGQVYISSTTVTTDGTGLATFNVIVPRSALPNNGSTAPIWSATATGATMTSEFSNVPPSLLSSGPLQGPAGTEVYLNGNGFSGNESVFIGNQQITPSDVEVFSPSQIRITTPAAANGAFRVVRTDSLGNTISGEATTTQTFSTVPAPPNDNFPGTNLTTENGSIYGTTLAATSENGEPNHDRSSSGETIWYSWTAIDNGSVEFNTATSDPKAGVAVYTRADATKPVSVTNLQSVGDSVASAQISRFNATKNTTYYIAVYAQGEPGTTQLIWSFDPSIPRNDKIAGATVIGASGGTLSATTRGATLESGEPLHAGRKVGASVWFKWTAPENDYISVDTQGSQFDTVLAAYTTSASAPTVTALSGVGSNDDAESGVKTSAVWLAVRKGVTYYFALAGYEGQAGNYVFRLRPASLFQADAEGVTIRWAYGRSGDWNNRENWRDTQGNARLPDFGDVVAIDAPGTYVVSYSGAGEQNEIQRLFIGKNASRQTQVSRWRSVATATSRRSGVRLGVTDTNQPVPTTPPSEGAVNATLQLSGNSLQVNNGGSVSVGSTLALSGATLRNSGLMGVLGAFNWSGGTLEKVEESEQDGQFLVAANAKLQISGGKKELFNHKIYVASGAQALWNGGTIESQYAAIQNAGLFTLSGQYAFVAVTGEFDGGQPEFVNLEGGTLRKSASATDAFDSIRFSNFGTLELTDGITTVGQGSSYGVFSLSGADILFNNQHFFEKEISTFSGSGRARFGEDADIAIEQDVRAQNVSIEPGSQVRGARELSAGRNTGQSGTLSWSGGDMLGLGRTYVAPGSALKIEGADERSLFERTLSNAGEGTWSATGEVEVGENAKIQNSGVLRFQTDALLPSGDRKATLQNTGSLLLNNKSLSFGGNVSSSGLFDLRTIPAAQLRVTSTPKRPRTGDIAKAIVSIAGDQGFSENGGALIADLSAMEDAREGFVARVLTLSRDKNKPTPLLLTMNAKAPKPGRRWVFGRATTGKIEGELAFVSNRTSPNLGDVQKATRSATLEIENLRGAKIGVRIAQGIAESDGQKTLSLVAQSKVALSREGASYAGNGGYRIAARVTPICDTAYLNENLDAPRGKVEFFVDGGKTPVASATLSPTTSTTRVGLGGKTISVGVSRAETVLVLSPGKRAISVRFVPADAKFGAYIASETSDLTSLDVPVPVSTITTLKAPAKLKLKENLTLEAIVKTATGAAVTGGKVVFEDVSNPDKPRQITEARLNSAGTASVSSRSFFSQAGAFKIRARFVPNDAALIAPSQSSPAQNLTIEPDLVPSDVRLSGASARENERVLNFTLSFAPRTQAAGQLKLSTRLQSSAGAASQSDFVALQEKVVNVPVGITELRVPVEIVDDALVEGAETFQVVGQSLSASLSAEKSADLVATGTIIDNDVPRISASPASAREGQNVRFVLALSQSAPNPVSLSYTVLVPQGTRNPATAGNDFKVKTGSLTIPRGQNRAEIAVETVADPYIENDENFVLRISGVGGATPANFDVTGTIVNDDPMNTRSRVSVADVSAREGARRLVFRVTFSPATTAPSLLTATVGALRQGTAEGAIPGRDYKPYGQKPLVIPARTSAIEIPIDVYNDVYPEADDKLKLTLSDLSLNLFGGDLEAVGTILNDDAASNSLFSGKIVYSMNGDLWLVNADATHRVRLTSGPDNDTNPRFSSDGMQVIFTRGSLLMSLDLSVAGATPRTLGTAPRNPAVPRVVPSPTGNAQLLIEDGWLTIVWNGRDYRLAEGQFPGFDWSIGRVPETLLPVRGAAQPSSGSVLVAPSAPAS